MSKLSVHQSKNFSRKIKKNVIFFEKGILKVNFVGNFPTIEQTIDITVSFAEKQPYGYTIISLFAQRLFHSVTRSTVWGYFVCGVFVGNFTMKINDFGHNSL